MKTKTTLLPFLMTLVFAFSYLLSSADPCTITNANIGQGSKVTSGTSCVVTIPVTFDIAPPNGGAKYLGLYFYKQAIAPDPGTDFPLCTPAPANFLGNVIFTYDYVSGTITNVSSCPNTAATVTVATAATPVSNLNVTSVSLTVTLTLANGPCTDDFISGNLYASQAESAGPGTNASCVFKLANSVNLPVTWGTLTAVNNGGRLLVNWQTVSEQNVKSFTVEASADGQTWKAIGTVNPQTGGNSTDLLSYSFTSSLPLALGGISIAMLLLSVFVRSKALRIAMVIVVIGFVASCGKDLSRNDVSGKDTMYVRIVQTDNSGGLQYSKIVKVINE